VTDSPLLGLLVLAALVAVPLVLRRVKSAQPGSVRVLGRTALHRNAVVAVVEVGDRRLLLGAGEKGIELLAELDGDPARPHDLGEDQDGPTESLPGPTDAGLWAHRTTTTDTDGALDALLGPVGSSATEAGPGIGLVDRLRAMTVRVPQPQGGAGRPIRVPLRR
jgi:flagellar biogenesis protein FliO